MTESNIIASARFPPRHLFLNPFRKVVVRSRTLFVRKFWTVRARTHVVRPRSNIVPFRIVRVRSDPNIFAHIYSWISRILLCFKAYKDPSSYPRILEFQGIVFAVLLVTYKQIILQTNSACEVVKRCIILKASHLNPWTCSGTRSKVTFIALRRVRMRNTQFKLTRWETRSSNWRSEKHVVTVHFKCSLRISPRVSLNCVFLID